MSDETKVCLAIIGLVAAVIIGGGALIYTSERDKAVLRQHVCVNPDSVACALAVRR